MKTLPSCKRTALLLALAGLSLTCRAVIPDLQPGLWETVSKNPKTGKTETMSACYTKEFVAMERKVTDDLARNPNRPCKVISTSGDVNSGNGSDVVECTLNGTTWRTTSQGTASAVKIHSVSHSEYVKGENRGIPPDRESDMNFKGACPAGMEGGDTIMPNGKKMNVMKLWQQK